MPRAARTLLTQGYTPEIVKIIHVSIVQGIARLNKSSAKLLPDGSHDPSSVVPYKGRSVLQVGIDEMQEADALEACA